MGISRRPKKVRNTGKRTEPGTKGESSLDILYEECGGDFNVMARTLYEQDLQPSIQAATVYLTGYTKERTFREEEVLRGFLVRSGGNFSHFVRLVTRRELFKRFVVMENGKDRRLSFLMTYLIKVGAEVEIREGRKSFVPVTVDLSALDVGASTIH